MITFLNKYDRPGREPLELLDEIEEQIGLRPTPATWPVGISGDFRGVVDRRTGEFTRFTRTTRGSAIAPEEIVDADRAAAEEGSAWTHAHDESGLLDAVGADVDLESFLAGESTPVFVGSALTNFGVRTCSTQSSIWRPHPSLDPTIDGRASVRSTGLFGVRVQGPGQHGSIAPRPHRVRPDLLGSSSSAGWCSPATAPGKPFATKYASTVFGAERTTVDEAYPGDVVGLVNATGLNIGDSLYETEPVTFPPIPRFSPEVFASARPLDTGKSKQFRKGLAQLDEEGVVQVLRDPDMGDSAPILAAVGQLQFDVFADRLDVEFNAPIEVLSAPYESIRLTDEPSARRLREIGGIRVMERGDGHLVALFESRYRLQRIESDEPDLMLDHIIAG